VKKIFALLTALFLYQAHFATQAPAFTLAEHEANVKKYVQAMNKAEGVRKTYCDRNGAEVKAIDTGQLDTVRYVQGADDYAVELRPTGDVVELATRNPAFRLPDGSGPGDSIEKVMKAGLIPGDYRRDIKDGAAFHIWIRDGIMTIVTERGAKITEIIFLNSSRLRSVTLNENYQRFLVPGDEGKDVQDGQDGAQGGGLPPAGSELNDSTDAVVINSYPLPQRDKNTLGIQHRGAYKLYSQKKYKDAYAAFSKLADEYSCNYLSAYWAGVAAGKLKKPDEARAWFERALEVNPDYRPARDALSGEKSAPSGSGGGSSPNGYTPRREWDKLLSAGDLAVAGKIYEVLTSLGATESEVAKKLGKPTSTFSQGYYNGEKKYYAYGGKKSGNAASDWNDSPLSFEFFTGKGWSYVTTVMANSPSKNKLKHVNLGDGIDSVRKKFGRDFDYDDGEQFSYNVKLRDIPGSDGEYEEAAIVFYVDKNKKVTGIVAVQREVMQDEGY
jgi:tetratricopeptide (TPR) repeat protein